MFSPLADIIIAIKEKGNLALKGKANTLKNKKYVSALIQPRFSVTKTVLPFYVFFEDNS